MMVKESNVNVGIFWIVGEELYAYTREAEVGKNRPYIHGGYELEFARTWNKVLKYKCPYSGYKQHTHGEIAYDSAKSMYVIAVPTHISEYELALIRERFALNDANSYVMRSNYYDTRRNTEEYASQILLCTDSGAYETARIYEGELKESRVFAVDEVPELIRYLSAYHLYNDVRSEIYTLQLHSLGRERETYPHNIIEYNGMSLKVRGSNIYATIYSHLALLPHSIDYNIEDYIEELAIHELTHTRAIAQLYTMSSALYLEEYDEYRCNMLVDDCLDIINHHDIDILDYRRLHASTDKLLRECDGDRLPTILDDIMMTLGANRTQGKYSEGAICLIHGLLRHMRQTYYDLRLVDMWSLASDRSCLDALLVGYPYELEVKVLRGEEELTGNLIEMTSKAVNILIECGRSLTNKTDELEPIEQEVLSKHYDAVFISHNHLDHNGLIEKMPKDVPIFMGERSIEVYRLQHPHADLTNVVPYIDGHTLTIKGEIDVKPFLADHSCVDSHMLYISSITQSILYTGDYRAHGRQNYDALLSRLPQNVDILITEGTNAHSTEFIMSERTIEHKMSKILGSTKMPAFAMCSSTNIDRIVSIYKAAAHNGRDLLVSLDEARLLNIFEDKGVPNPLTFERVKVYYPRGIFQAQMSSFTDMRCKSVSIDELSQMSDYVMLVTTSTLPYLKKLARLRGEGLIGCPFIYSMWKSYMDEDWMRKFVDELEYMGAETHIAHTSGHADSTAIDRLVERVQPRRIIRVHTRI